MIGREHFLHRFMRCAEFFNTSAHLDAILKRLRHREWVWRLIGDFDIDILNNGFDAFARAINGLKSGDRKHPGFC